MQNIQECPCITFLFKTFFKIKHNKTWVRKNFFFIKILSSKSNSNPQTLANFNTCFNVFTGELNTAIMTIRETKIKLRCTFSKAINSCFNLFVHHLKLFTLHPTLSLYKAFFVKSDSLYSFWFIEAINPCNFFSQVLRFNTYSELLRLIFT